MTWYFYIAHHSGEVNITKVGIAVCPRCRMVEYNNGIKHRTGKPGLFSICHTEVFDTHEEAKSFEKKILNVCRSAFKPYIGRESFYVDVDTIKELVEKMK